MKEITIYRPTEIFNCFRNYQIFINENKMASIGNGKEITLNIPEDADISAKIDWCGSNSIKVQSQDNKVVVQSNPILTFSGVAFILLQIIVFLFFTEQSFYPIFIFALPFSYFISFGRKKYLKIGRI